jgi:hypothetical protein
MIPAHSTFQRGIGLALLWAALGASGAWAARPRAAVGPGTGPKCLPTCTATDGRFLTIAGQNFVTLSDTVFTLKIAVPVGAGTFSVGFFDGESGGISLGGSHWDNGVLAEYHYRLSADSNNDGIPEGPVDLVPGFPAVSSFGMPDNAWIDFTVATSPAAQAPSGNYFYVLEIELLNPLLTTLNAFKVRTDAMVSGLDVEPIAQPFSYIATWTSLADITIIYPGFPATSPTTYDGVFSFWFDAPLPQQEMAVWDGDFDRGKFDGTEQDTDDADTPGAPFLPTWATPDAVSEAIAVGGVGITGAPADDRNSAGTGIYLVRPPSVRYDLIHDRTGATYLNDNPSGNQEWEQFKLSTAPFDGSVMDYSVADIPAGLWELRAQGVDMQNLNALLLPFPVLCVNEQGDPCQTLRTLRLGDTVFSDPDGDGVQDAGEPGIPGVTLELLDEVGAFVASTTTDALGQYGFQVEAGTYTVHVAAANFAPGGPLAGATSTTGGEELTRALVGAIDLTYDFGYRLPVPPGTGTGTPGFWKNHPEAWPVEQITIGGITYTKAQAIAWMETPEKGDKTLTMFRHLVSAKLNVAIGNPSSCIAATISAADQWMATYGPVGSGVKASSPAWVIGGPLATTLDDYNNGRLCAPHRG